MIKKTSIILILSVLFFFYFMSSEPASSMLGKSTTNFEDGAAVITETSFIDPNGRITMASDKGYAILRTTKDSEGKTILEEYLGADGNPVMLPAGYSAIRRLYTDGLNTTITYLDTEGQPVVIGNGYETIQRTYNDLRMADTDTYWIGETQVSRKQGYAELKRIYGTGADAKRVVRQEYRESHGGLVLNTSGYAILTRKYNEAGKKREERYFRTNGEPVVLPSGYSGYTRLYDEQGRVVETTYIGIDGSPVRTTHGYAVIRVRYDESESRYLYFDENGEACTAEHGEYGYQMENGRKVYLNKNGTPLQRIDIFLGSNPIAVVIIDAAFIIFALIAGRKARIGLLFICLGFIAMMTLAWREGINTVKGELFWSYRQFLNNSSIRRGILNNIFLFIPLGAIFFGLLRQSKNCAYGLLWTAALCLAVSIGAELIQLSLKIGVFEFDDMVSNTVGGGIGAVVAAVLRSGFISLSRSDNLPV